MSLERYDDNTTRITCEKCGHENVLVSNETKKWLYRVFIVPKHLMDVPVFERRPKGEKATLLSTSTLKLSNALWKHREDGPDGKDVFWRVVHKKCIHDLVEKGVGTWSGASSYGRLGAKTVEHITKFLEQSGK